MITGKTKSGFQFTIDENVAKSKRFMKLLARISRASKMSDDGKAGMEASEAEDELEILVLGETQQEKLIEHCDKKSETGMSTVDDFAKELNEILSIAGERNKAIKNS